MTLTNIVKTLSVGDKVLRPAWSGRWLTRVANAGDSSNAEMLQESFDNSAWSMAEDDFLAADWSRAP
jgi:hypothetical protein